MNELVVSEVVRGRHIDAARSIEKYVATAGALSGMNCSLADGLAGIALFYQSLLQHDDNSEYRDKFDRLVDRIYTIVEQSNSVDFSFYVGLPGVGFALERIALNEQNGDSIDVGVNDELDEALLQHLSVPTWTGHFDLVSGLVGAGAYALSRSNAEMRDKLFKAAFEKLMLLAESTSEGICWRTGSHLMRRESASAAVPNESYNLGVAHGNPGVVALFADALAAGVQPPGLRNALEGVTEWVMRHGHPEADGFYGYNVGDGYKARAAWCYGDPGNAIAIVKSGQALGNRSIIEFGIECGLNAARRPLAKAGVNDHGVCHGSVGLGLMFMSLFRATGQPEFLAAADTWYEITLRAVESGDVDILKTCSGKGTRRLDHGALTGTSGIGLALLDRLDAKSNGWSKWLLV